MGLRKFEDPGGTEWTVWDTYPEQGRLQLDAVAGRLGTPGATEPRVRQRYRGGWLTFTSGTARRRLSPVPPRWMEADDEALRGFLERSEDVPRTPKA